MAPLVGILAERCFGFDTKQHHHRGAAVSHAQSAQVVAQNLNNARALERGLLLVLVVPVCIKFVVRPFLSSRLCGSGIVHSTTVTDVVQGCGAPCWCSTLAQQHPGVALFTFLRLSLSRTSAGRGTEWESHAC